MVLRLTINTCRVKDPEEIERKLEQGYRIVGTELDYFKGRFTVLQKVEEGN